MRSIAASRCCVADRGLAAKSSPQIQCHGKFAARLIGWNRDMAASVAVILEPRQPARLRFIGIDRERIIVAPARMRYMIDAAAERAPAPAIENIESQRRMHRDGRVQARGRLPGLEADGGDPFAAAGG